MKHYLATTGISEIWDLNGKVSLLGPWCLTDPKNRHLLEGKAAALIVSPWRQAHTIKSAADHCRDLYEMLLPKLGEQLNALHGVSYSVRYWRVLIGPWLLSFIGVFYDRYTRIENAIEKHPDLCTHALPEEQCALEAADMREFIDEKTEDDQYNLALFSLAARQLCPTSIVACDHLRRPVRGSRSARQGSKGRLFYNLVMKPLDIILKDHIMMTDMYHLNPLDMCLLKYETGLGAVSFKEFPVLDGLKKCYSSQKRAGLTLSNDTDAFVSLLAKVIPAAVPTCYVENYDFYKKNSRRSRVRDSIRAIGSSVGWYSKVEFSFYAAEAAANGARLIDFQHGGNYGFSLSVPLETLSLERDVFYTWGWNSAEGATRALPNPHLSRLKETHLTGSKKVLFIGVSMPRYHYRFHSCLQPDDMSKYFDDKRKFFRSISVGIRKNILYRPYPVDYGIDEKQVVREECPDAEFIIKERPSDWMQRARLVVVDHPHTSFLEALTVNVPCVFYWDHDVYLMREDAMKYFELLRECGIVYRDPENAARKINEIYDDPAKWWNSDAVQSARKAFCDRYALAREDWMQVWAKELKEWSHERTLR